MEPRPAVVQAALSKVTEVLVRELVQPGAACPDWSDFEWRMACAAAALHGISPLLCHTLRWSGPSSWASFLVQQRAHVADRQARIERLAARIEVRAHSRGIAILALKGAALHAIGLYQPGERPMADLDLLVEPRDGERAGRLIEGLGYRVHRCSWKERAFAPLEGQVPGSLGEHSGNDITIELHEHIREKLPLAATDITASVFPRSPRPGLNSYPSLAALMLHLLLHASGSMAGRALRFLQLHDVARLTARMHPEDWEELVPAEASPSTLWWLLPPLELMSRYHGIAIPEPALGRLIAACPAHLRRAAGRRTVSQFSLSRVWVDALPGLAWSRSIPAMLSYVRSRVRPDRDHVALRQVLANTEPWTRNGSWSELSQTRRIFRWLKGRQTRPATMHAVRAALAQR